MNNFGDDCIRPGGKERLRKKKKEVHKLQLGNTLLKVIHPGLLKT